MGKPKMGKLGAIDEEMVTHRLATIQGADVILVMQDGKVDFTSKSMRINV